jgi:hypothetical protein
LTSGLIAVLLVCCEFERKTMKRRDLLKLAAAAVISPVLPGGKGKFDDAKYIIGADMSAARVKESTGGVHFSGYYITVLLGGKSLPTSYPVLEKPLLYGVFACKGREIWYIETSYDDEFSHFWLYCYPNGEQRLCWIGKRYSIIEIDLVNGRLETWQHYGPTTRVATLEAWPPKPSQSDIFEVIPEAPNVQS